MTPAQEFHPDTEPVVDAAEACPGECIFIEAVTPAGQAIAGQPVAGQLKASA